MLTRNLEKARDAFKNKSKEASVKAHKGKHEPHSDQGKYIKSLIYGGLDGWYNYNLCSISNRQSIIRTCIIRKTAIHVETVVLIEKK